jgi:DNA-binding MarR family transcriptional regulator
MMATTPTPSDLRQWRQILSITGKRDGRYVEIKRGSKLPTRKGWNQTENTLSAKQAKAHIANGYNIGLATGTGGLYVLDFDNDAERGHECAQLSGGLYTYRENAPHKAKFIFSCPDPIPTRLKSKAHGVDLLGINANGTHAQAVIAGIHDTGAPILWGGHTVPVLPADTVAALWEEWTGAELFATENEEREPSATYAGADLARVADALKYVDADAIDYTQWQGIIAAIHDAFGDEALDTVVDWANGKPGEVEAKWHTYDREYTGKRATLRTIFYLARKSGWPDVWLQERLREYRQWLASPECIEKLKEDGFRNAEQARRLLDTILQKCEEMGSLSIAPGYAYLVKHSTIGQSDIARYLARLFTGGFINLQMGKKGGNATVIELLPKSVLRYTNSIATTGNTIRVAQNWNIYREQRASEAFMNNHHAYSSTRTKATLPPLGNNGLGALMALLDGPITTKEAAEDIGYSYDVMARSLRRYVANGLVEVTVGARGLKTYSLKEEWREILKANIPLMPTYAVQLVRHVDALKSRERILLFNGEDEKADKVGKEYIRMAALLAKVKAEAGIIRFGHVDKSIVEGDLSIHTDEELIAEAKAGRRKPKADTTPTVNKHEERRRRLTHALVIGERAEHRLPVAMTKSSDANNWRRKEYAKALPQAESRWEEFHAWAVVEYGVGWWVGLDKTDVLGRYKIFEFACERVPTIKWAGQTQPDYHQLLISSA